jgi:hypothetical protein
MFPVRYALGFYIIEDGIPHSRRRENFQSYIVSLNLLSENLVMKIYINMYFVYTNCLLGFDAV